jgi:hypothetical protein
MVIYEQPEEPKPIVLSKFKFPEFIMSYGSTNVSCFINFQPTGVAPHICEMHCYSVTLLTSFHLLADFTHDGSFVAVWCMDVPFVG